MEFSLGDSILLQVAASRASGEGCDSWEGEEELRKREGGPVGRPKIN